MATQLNIIPSCYSVDRAMPDSPVNRQNILTLKSKPGSLFCSFLDIIFYTFIFIIFLSNISAQQVLVDPFKDAVRLLNKGDTLSAHKIFLVSANEFKNDSAYFSLAQIEIADGNYSSRQKASEYLKKAVFINPHQKEYKLALARLLKSSAFRSAENYYLEILEEDPKNIEALYFMARRYARDYYDYANSFFMTGGDYDLSYEEYSKEDLIRAKEYYEKIFDVDSNQPEAWLELGKLIIFSGEENVGRQLLEKLKFFSDKNICLLSGILNYKMFEFENSYSNFQRAFSFMSEEEEKFYKIASVRLFEGTLDTASVENIYWRKLDPMFLTEINERLLEHYSRVAIAKLFEQGESENLLVKSEILIRFGEPLERIRYRPQYKRPKTDIWKYGGKTFAFEDPFMSGDFQLASSDFYNSKFGMKSQVDYDSHSFMENLRKKNPVDHTANLPGEFFEIAHNISQFKNEATGETDVVVSYGLPVNDSDLSDEENILEHEAGIFFIKENDPEIIKKIKRENTLAAFNEMLHTGSIQITLPPVIGTLSFEVQKNKTKEISLNRREFTARNFSSDGLAVSDILLAGRILQGQDKELPLNRGTHSILPNPDDSISKNIPQFIYYEIYNLVLSANGLTDFEQKITIRNLNEEGEISSVLNEFLDVIGIGNNSESISMISNFNTTEQNPVVFFQLDLENYPEGDYLVSIEIRDNISGQAAAPVTKNILISR